MEHVYTCTSVNGSMRCINCGNYMTSDAGPCRGPEVVGEDIARAQAAGLGTQSDRQVGGGHYTDMQIQPWDVIDKFDEAEFIGYHRGVAISYVMRAGRKGDMAEDFEKAAHHLMKCAEELRRRRNGA